MSGYYYIAELSDHQFTEIKFTDIFFVRTEIENVRIQNSIFQELKFFDKHLLELNIFLS